MSSIHEALNKLQNGGDAIADCFSGRQYVRNLLYGFLWSLQKVNKDYIKDVKV